MKRDIKPIITIGLVILMMILLILSLKVVSDKIDTDINSEIEQVEVVNDIKLAKKKVKKTKKKANKKSKKKAKKKSKYGSLKVKTASRETYINYAQQYSGYDATQMSCLINLWQRESGWSATIRNKSNGACGIPQSLPCNKIKKQQGSYNWGAQIRWGINRINWVYKTPCNAWDHFKKYGGY